MATLTKDFGANRGDEMALLDDERQRTWAELDDRVNRLTNAMRDAGLGWGDTISVVAGNRCEWFEVAMACAHAGVTYVPVNWHWSPAELAYVLDDSGSSAVFVGHRFSEEVAAALDDEQTSGIRLAVAMGGTAGSRFDDYDDLLASASAGEPTDQALGGPMFYTSGTTGWPKGVRGALSGGGDEPIPPEVLQLISAGFSEFFPVPGVSVLCGPVYHSAQWAFSFLPMVGGSSVVMQHRYDSAGVLDLIDDHGGTNIHLVPTQMKRMLDLPAERRAGCPGVWAAGDKICAIGVHVRRGVTMHGLALNLNPTFRGSELIIPCGIADAGLTSVNRVLGWSPSPEAAAPGLADALARALTGRPATVLAGAEAKSYRPPVL